MADAGTMLRLRNARLGVAGKCFLRLIVAAVLVCSAPCVCAAPLLQVVYPRPEAPYDTRTGYPLAVLRLALMHLHVAFVLKPSTAVFTQARALRLLEDNQAITVGWSVATTERDARLRAIGIPIDRGLIGWRVLLIRQGDERRFKDIQTAAQLERIPMAQGQDWPDLAILRDSGFNVAAPPDYASLFSMLKQGHVDAVPRSVAEIGQELQSPVGAGLVAETHLLLHYPSALVFFVSRSNAPLAADLQKGLEEAIADGSLRRLFKLTYSQGLGALHLRGRRIIELPNPLLPAHMEPGSGDPGYRLGATQ